MKFLIVTVGIVVALTIVGVILYRFVKPRNEAFGGFREWVRNPDSKRAAADYFAARDALEVPDDISDGEIKQMVDRLFIQKDDDFNFERLKLVGGKAVPMLIAALEQPKTATTQFGDGGHALDAKSPFERIVNLLEPIGTSEAALPIAKYIDHQDDHFRKYAALALGSIGSAECIAPMLKALDDDDDYVRSFAMMGIQRGLKGKRCSKDFLDAVFPAITKLLDRNSRTISGRAPELLLIIDKDRAIPLLLSPEYFSVKNKEVHYIIRAMNTAGHLIAHDSLLPLLKEVKPLVGKYPHDYQYSEALIAYALNPDTSAEGVFRTELESANEKVQEAASKALAIMSGVTNAREVVFEALGKQGFDQLSQPQKHYYAVFVYDAEVNNGGHSQYFVNSSGDRWKSALAGLTAIGANARAKALRDATALFGADGPSVNNGARHRQIASFTDQQHKSLDELDRRYYSCEENIEALLAQYALKNKEDSTARN